MEGARPGVSKGLAHAANRRYAVDLPNRHKIKELRHGTVGVSGGLGVMTASQDSVPHSPSTHMPDGIFTNRSEFAGLDQFEKAAEASVLAAGAITTRHQPDLREFEGELRRHSEDTCVTAFGGITEGTRYTALG